MHPLTSAYGLPWRSLVFVEYAETAPRGALTISWRGRERRLPIRPIPVNLLGNTLVLGAPVVLVRALVWSVQALRRFLRRASSRCERCGYALAGLPSQTCPECGMVSRPSP